MFQSTYSNYRSIGVFGSNPILSSNDPRVWVRQWVAKQLPLPWKLHWLKLWVGHVDLTVMKTIFHICSDIFLTKHFLRLLRGSRCCFCYLGVAPRAQLLKKSVWPLCPFGDEARPTTRLPTHKVDVIILTPETADADGIWRVVNPDL